MISTSSAASGIVGQYRFSTCLSAGRRIGLGRKKFMPEAMHSLMLFSSAKAVSATIGAEKPNSRMSRVLWRPSRFGIYEGPSAIVGMSLVRPYLDVHEDQVVELLLHHAFLDQIQSLLSVLGECHI